MMKNLRRNVLILFVIICFSGFCISTATGNMQTKNAKAKPTETKIKKSPTPEPKKTKTTTSKTDKAKNTPTSKTAKKSDKAKPGTKTKSEKDKKSDKYKKSEKDKKSTAKTVKPPTKPSSSKTKNDTKKNVDKEKKPETQAQTAKTLKPAPKPVNKPTPTPKPIVNQKVIVSVTRAHILSEPNLDSTISQNLQIGAILTVLEKNEDWYKVQFAGDKNTFGGWVSKSVVTDFNLARRDEIYRNIAERNFKNNATDFASATEFLNFLTASQKEITEEKLLADLNFKRLMTLKAALKAIPADKTSENPYQIFLKENEKEIIYSEPAAEWYVRLDNFWHLHNQYKNLPIGEEIAWQAANNPIAGECEGYINCYLYKLRTTFGEYLNFYPGGNHSKEALTKTFEFLQPLAVDAKDKKIYFAASDTSDRAEFNKFLTDLRMIISKVEQLEKAKTIQQINQIAEGYR